MDSRDLLKAGRIQDCLATLKTEIRGRPADPKLRVFLFQLLAVLGDWERAMTQLKVAADMDADCQLMAHICQVLVNSEVFRREVFAGRRSPLIFGEPREWVGWLIRANEMQANGDIEAATALRGKAFEAAPASGGVINGEQFGWIADGDCRLGPLLEIVVAGRYYWVPMEGVRRIRMGEPTDLRDVLWVPATFNWTNEGESSGFILARYCGSEDHEDDAVKLCRKTVWNEDDHGNALGYGQRMLMTDQDDYAVLDTREILLNQ